MARRQEPNALVHFLDRDSQINSLHTEFCDTKTEIDFIYTGAYKRRGLPVSLNTTLADKFSEKEVSNYPGLLVISFNTESIIRTAAEASIPEILYFNAITYMRAVVFYGDGGHFKCKLRYKNADFDYDGMSEEGLCPCSSNYPWKFNDYRSVFAMYIRIDIAKTDLYHNTSARASNFWNSIPTSEFWNRHGSSGSIKYIKTGNDNNKKAYRPKISGLSSSKHTSASMVTDTFLLYIYSKKILPPRVSSGSMGRAMRLRYGSAYSRLSKFMPLSDENMLIVYTH